MPSAREGGEGEMMRFLLDEFRRHVNIHLYCMTVWVKRNKGCHARHARGKGQDLMINDTSVLAQLVRVLVLRIPTGTCKRASNYINPAYVSHTNLS